MKKAHIYTFGCKVNQYETQLLREDLEKKGYDCSGTIESADLVLINSCTVTAEADRQCRQLIRQVIKKNPGTRIVVTGCYAVRASEELRRLSPSVEILANKKTSFADKKERASSIAGFSGHTRAFIKVQDGCDAKCSYCIVPSVRPELWSRPWDEVISEIAHLAEGGCPEIVLTGIRLGRYSGGLVPLLKRILSIPGEFQVRLSSLEIKEISDDLVEFMRENPQRLCAHLHIPLQSGSDAILKLMKRPYTAGELQQRINSIYQALPDVGITTDVIVGFPGETEENFCETYSFIEKNSFSKLHVFPYSSRPGTPALALPGKVEQSVIRQRSQRLRDLDVRLQEKFWRKLIGKCRPAILEGKRNSILTDNYLRLPLRGPLPAVSSTPFTILVQEDGGKPIALMQR